MMVNSRRIPGVVIKKALSQTNYNKQNKVMHHLHRPVKGGLAPQMGIKKKSLSMVPFSLHALGDVLEPKQSMKSFDEEIMLVQVENAFEEAVVDIDVSDTENTLAVVEYVDDICANYRKMESDGMVSPDYMLTQQVDINKRMRAKLIDWLIEVHRLCHYRHETLFLTVHIIDRFLAKQSVSRKNLQLVGMVAMLLACKYEEVSAPVVAYLINISDKTYTRSEILEMENLMLHTLDFNLSFPTPYMFLKRFLKATQSDLKLDQMSSFLLDLCLVEYETLKFAPSLLAAASVYTAQCTLYGFKKWSKTCEWYTKYSQEQLLECSRMMVQFHQRAARGRLTAVCTKYNTSNFGYAANCEPAMFIVDEIHL